MRTFEEEWYPYLLKLGDAEAVYTLIHTFLDPEWEPTHVLDIVVVREDDLPPHLDPVPPKYWSRMAANRYRFLEPGYLLLESKKLTPFLQAATWARMITDYFGQEFIELRFAWTAEAEAIVQAKGGYVRPKPVEKPKPKPEPEPLKFNPLEGASQGELSLLAAYYCLYRAEHRGWATENAGMGHAYLDQQLVEIPADGNQDVLKQVARRMLGYNIVAMVYAWNDMWEDAQSVDAIYIHNPWVWPYLRNHIGPYLEMLMIKKHTSYIDSLFADLDFRNYFLPHYEAYISLFHNPDFPITRMREVVRIFNQVEHGAERYG